MKSEDVQALPQILTTKEAAAALRRSEQTLRRWSATKTGPLHPLHVHGRLAWPRDEVLALLRSAA